METVFGLDRIKKYRKPVVALGVFDGLHCGHRRILRYAVLEARRIRGTSLALTFYPHPRGQDRLYSLGHRQRLLKELGLDVCIVINFNRAFAKISALAFIRDILVKKLGAYYVCVGRNFGFGRGAEGDARLLTKLARIYNFKLKVFDVIKAGRKTVSSTYIRALIRRGKLESAQRLLLRPVNVLGTVVKGASLARRLGFPTANINPHHEVTPPAGVYAVKVIFRGRKYAGICNIGHTPAQKPKHIEVHLFDFKKDIYGQDLEIQFIKRIRGQRKFASHDLLIAQIKKDVASVRALFSRH